MSLIKRHGWPGVKKQFPSFLAQMKLKKPGSQRGKRYILTCGRHKRENGRYSSGFSAEGTLISASVLPQAFRRVRNKLLTLSPWPCQWQVKHAGGDRSNSNPLRIKKMDGAIIVCHFPLRFPPLKLRFVAPLKLFPLPTPNWCRQFTA